MLQTILEEDVEEEKSKTNAQQSTNTREKQHDHSFYGATEQEQHDMLATLIKENCDSILSKKNVTVHNYYIYMQETKLP